MARPDQWTSHYNLGNYHLRREEYASAVSAFQTATRLDPREATILVNLSIAHARQGDNAGAKTALDRALALEPANAEANFNLGLLEAELQDLPRAEEHLRRALGTDPQMAPAAYNLCVLLGDKAPDEALELCRRAAAQQPREPRYAWTYAYYLAGKGDGKAAAAILENLLGRQPGYADGHLLLADLLLKQGDREKARQVYERALGSDALSPQDRTRIHQALLAMEARQAGSPE
jgi:tetratricopeptide (TPR) repeat protein